ncbi:MAG TPA: magnesium/cobalt transporter CorA [Gemmatimonadaceae bacterium]|nr:magnesium/cobalt transporter CorA [Gemmatimonadaceae bacterium]
MTVQSAQRDANLPLSWVREANGELKRDLPLRELIPAVNDPSCVVWVDIDSTNRHHVAFLEKVFKFHPLAIEDLLNPNSRVKLDEYENCLFAIVRGVEFNPHTPDPHDLRSFNLCCFLGKNFLVTSHATPVPAIDAFMQRCETNPETLARGAARAMYIVLDSAVDQYFPVLDQVNDFIDALEERVFERYSREVLTDLFSVKRTVLSLRRHLTPERDVFNALANRPSTLLTIEEQRYFRDVYDHILRINDSLEQYRDLLSSVLEASLTQTSNRLGMVTKGLSVVATISVPFVVVSGMWGMNFTHIPLSEWPHGFWVMMALQLALGFALLAYLRHKDWL